jgi:hypothetical protein
MLAAGTPTEKLHHHLTSLGRMIQEWPALFTVLGELDLRSNRDVAVRAIIDHHEAGWGTVLTDVLAVAVVVTAALLLLPAPWLGPAALAGVLLELLARRVGARRTGPMTECSSPAGRTKSSLRPGGGAWSWRMAIAPNRLRCASRRLMAGAPGCVSLCERGENDRSGKPEPSLVCQWSRSSGCA